MGQPATYWPDTKRFLVPFAGSVAVSVNDLVYSNSGSALPASSMADAGTEAANQAAFKPLFMGVSKEKYGAAQTPSLLQIDTEYIGKMACDSGTWAVGELVMACENSGGNGLENQKIKKTTDKALAIGYCVVAEPTAVTSVTVKLISQVFPAHVSMDVLDKQAHVADVAASTQTALTDNGGGTADGTVASMAAPTTITDSTGDSGTHDDTLADGNTTTAFTADNGGGTADGTVDSQAAPTTLTDSTGLSGSHNDTLEAVTSPTLTDWNGSSVYPSAVQGEAISTAITALNQNASDTAQKVIELVALAGTAQNNLKEITTKVGTLITDNGVQNQNISDLGQKIIEIVTWMGTVQANFKEVTTQLAAAKADSDAQVTKINAILAALESAGVLATS